MIAEAKTPAERRGHYRKEFRSVPPSLVVDQERTIPDIARSLGLSQ
jgi:hypothetical protein